MTRRRLLSFIAVVLASSPGGGASSAQAPSPVYSRLAMGVVRGDGIFLPLASRENETWTILRSYDSVGDAGLYKLLASAWVMEMRGFEGDAYVIIEPGTGQALNLDGGGC